MRITSALTDVVLIGVGVFLLVGIFCPQVPTLGPRETLWHYAETRVASDELGKVPGLYSVSGGEGSLKVATTAPIDDPGEHNLVLTRVTMYPAFMYNNLLAWPFTLLASALMVMGAFRRIVAFSEK